MAERFPPVNSVLANLYRNGHDSVSWHADDEAVLGHQPTIATVSLGALRRFVLPTRASGQRVNLDLPPGSLLLMSGDTQRAWVHAVPKTSRTVGARISLTFATSSR